MPTHQVHVRVFNDRQGCRYELLTHTRVFPRLTDRQAIIDCLAGRALLPWEDPARSGELDMMKGLRRSVLACLSRDPAKRPTTELLLRRCVCPQACGSRDMIVA